MEPQSALSAQRLDKFTNVPGTINFHAWKQMFLASIIAKGLENSLQAQDEDALTAPKLVTANKADATLMFGLYLYVSPYVRFVPPYEYSYGS